MHSLCIFKKLSPRVEVSLVEHQHFLYSYLHLPSYHHLSKPPPLCPRAMMSPSLDQSVRRWLSFPPFLVLPFCLVSIASFPGNVLASPSKLDHNCRSSIERSIQTSGFLVQPPGFISDRIQSSNSYDRALSEIWSSPPPAEISYADSRGNKRYYISI